MDSNTTKTTIRLQLAELHLYMPKVKHDVTKFNEYVRLQLPKLAARGEATLNLMTFLMKAYY